MTWTASVCPFPCLPSRWPRGRARGSRRPRRSSSRRPCGGSAAIFLERYRQPVLLETFLPGREVTIGLWGTGPKAEVIGTLEVLLGSNAEPEVYSYVNKERSEELVDYRLVTGESDPEIRRAEEPAVAVWRTLGLPRRRPDGLPQRRRGNPHFLEVNPLAGIHPFHSDLPMICTAVGVTYVTLIERIVSSAMERAAGNRKPKRP